jgi:hypothetical protein
MYNSRDLRVSILDLNDNILLEDELGFIGKRVMNLAVISLK